MVNTKFLSDLNLDCIIEICKYLPISDQYNLANTSERMYDIIWNIWQHQSFALDLSELNLNYPHLRDVMNLVENSIKSIKTTTAQLNLFMSATLGLTFKNLRSMNITGEEEQNTFCFYMLYQSYPNLNELKLYNVAVNLDIISRMSKLKTLMLKFCTLEECLSAFDFFNRFHLKHLDLRVTDAGPEIMYSTLRNSRSVGMETLIIPQSMLNHILEELKYLKYLKDLSVQCDNILDLNNIIFSNCLKFGKKSVYSLSIVKLIIDDDIMNDIIRLQSLRVVDFAYIRINCIQELLLLERLEELSLTGCTGFSDSSLINFICGSQQKKLRFLDVKGCRHLTPRFIWRLAVLIDPNRKMEINITDTCLTRFLIKPQEFANYLKLTDRISIPEKEQDIDKYLYGFKYDLE